MLPLLIGALATDLTVLVTTIPIFTIVRGTEVEIPFAIILVSLGIAGVLAAQISFARKGKEHHARTLVIAALIQSLLMTVLNTYVFINIVPDYYWYPSVVMALNIILIGLLSATIAIYRRRNNGQLLTDNCPPCAVPAMAAATGSSRRATQLKSPGT
jgi:hypothetical protein